MAIDIEAPPDTRLSVAHEVEGRTIIPIKWWAWTGVGALAVWGYVWIRWLASGLERPKIGVTPLPSTMKILIYANQAAMPLLLMVGVYWFVIRPWRKTGRIGFDGLLLIAFQTGWWQEQWANFLKPSYIFNTGLWGFNSWAQFMPGMAFPNARLLVEPPIWMWPMYSTFAIPYVLGACYLMRKCKARWPQLGNMGLIGIGLAFLAVFDIVGECSMVWMGMYIYPTAAPKVSLFAGHYYQFPLYETLFMVTTYLPIVCLRYFVDDKGRTLIDRGIDRLKTKRKTGVRLLAIIGVWNLIFVLGYNIPLGVVSGVWGGAIPKDVQERSYFIHGICGPLADQTKLACPSPSLPIVTDSSRKILRDGTLTPTP